MKTGDLLHTFLDQHHGDSANLDVQLIIAHVIGRPRSWLLAHLDTPLTSLQFDSAKQAFAQLQAGTPLPYLLGHWDFFGLDFDITPDVLIPRPETELLVEKAVKWLGNSPERRTVADIGTGCGAIAVAIAMHVPTAHILATDISSKALKIAKRNAERHGVTNQIEFIECDLLPQKSKMENHKSKISLICANLPYIPTETLRQLPIYGREPTLALDGGEDGLDLYRRLFHLAPDWLAAGGMMLLEIEATQGSQALSLTYDTFDNVKLQLHQDLAGHDRLLEIMLP